MKDLKKYMKKHTQHNLYSNTYLFIVLPVVLLTILHRTDIKLQGAFVVFSNIYCLSGWLANSIKYNVEGVAVCSSDSF